MTSDTRRNLIVLILLLLFAALLSASPLFLPERLG